MSRAWAIAGCAAVLVGSALLVVRAGFPPTAEPQAVVEPKPIRVVLGETSATRHDIGTVARGGRHTVAFVILNPGQASVTLGAIRSSCECLTVELDPTRIEAGAEVGGRAVIDLSHEPAFAGGLMLDASASSEDGGRMVFALKLSVAVK